MGNRFYQKSKAQVRHLLKEASDLVPHGIFAVESIDKGYIEICNIPMSRAEIKKARKDYGRRGFKVYANE